MPSDRFGRSNQAQLSKLKGRSPSSHPSNPALSLASSEAAMSEKKEHFPGFVDPPSPSSPVEELEEFAREIEPLALEYEDMQALPAAR
jgi:hypothetical protein